MFVFSTLLDHLNVITFSLTEYFWNLNPIKNIFCDVYKGVIINVLCKQQVIFFDVGGGGHNVDSYLDFLQTFKCIYSFIYATSTSKVQIDVAESTKSVLSKISSRIPPSQYKICKRTTRYSQC
jgi:hypothetical protein